MFHSLSVGFWDVGQPEEASVYVFNVRSTAGGTESSSGGGGSDSMESYRGQCGDAKTVSPK